MPARRTAIPAVRTESYRLKMLRLHGAPLALIFGSELAYTITKPFVDDMTRKWQERFGEIRQQYFEVVAKILDDEGLIGAERAKYRAFTNELISKVLVKGTEDVEFVIAKHVRLKCDERILRRIANALVPLAAKGEVPEATRPG